MESSSSWQDWWERRSTRSRGNNQRPGFGPGSDVDYIYLPGNSSCSPFNVITLVCPLLYLWMSVCHFFFFFSIQTNAKYPPLNGDWNMGAACLGNHLMSTCQRYQGGTKSKTTGLSNHKRHGGTDFSGICGRWKESAEVLTGISFGIAHVSKLIPPQNYGFLSSPKSHFHGYGAGGILRRGASQKKEKGESTDVLFFDLI